jgi:hypothetical protein
MLRKNALFHCLAANNKAYLLFNGDLVRLDNITNKNQFALLFAAGQWNSASLYYINTNKTTNIILRKFFLFKPFVNLEKYIYHK